METVKYKVVNAKGAEVGTVDLDAAVFAAAVDASVVHQTVRWQRAKRRAGTASTLTKGMMKGGNRKPRPQKGSGQSRAGSNTSPVWVGGAVSHGPQPRSYEFRLAKRTRRQALAAVLSDKVKKNRLVVLDSLAVPSGKTRDVASVLKQLGIAGSRAVMVLSTDQESVRRASANIAGLLPLPVAGVNVYDLLRNRYLVATRDQILALQERVKAE